MPKVFTSESQKTGEIGENIAVKFLVKHGFSILGRNYTKKWGEIDIIAEKKGKIYFVEVKYRGSESQGSGFEYIGPQKLGRLKFAARVWTQSSGWEGDYRIYGAEVTGPDFETVELVEIE